MGELRKDQADGLAKADPELAEVLGGLLRDSLRPATRRAYEADWNAWLRWCEGASVRPSLPIDPELVALWVAEHRRRGLALATVRRRVATLGQLHRRANLVAPGSHPIVREALAGYEHQAEQVREARPVTASQLRAALPRLGYRDRVIMLVGWLGCLRRSELVRLRWGDVEEVGHGVVLALRNTKGAALEYVALARSNPGLCPIRAMGDLERDRYGGRPAPADHRITGVSVSTIGRTVQRAVRLAGSNPAGYSAHSLRAGGASAAALAGVELALMKRHTRHRSLEVAARYVRVAEVGKSPVPVALARALRGDYS